MKKNFALAVIVLSVLFVPFVFAQEAVSEYDVLEEAAVRANKRTALRALNLAKEYAARRDWNSVIAQAKFGLAYDESISDLWYVYAIALNETGETKAIIVPLVTKALETASWYDYNRDGARILYADLLCDTTRFAEACEILDSSPVLFSADSEYIRAKASYRMKDAASVERARVKIETARKMYPEDIRFPLLFFKYENPDDETPEVKSMAEGFVNRMSLYENQKDYLELEMYAILFSKGEKQRRLLQSFSARGLEHPGYAEAALRAGLIDEETAFDYFTSFADGSIQYSQLISFIQLIKTEAVKQLLQTYMNSYAGIIIYDSDDDGIDNMYVKYYRGRPETIVYDDNQDGIINWRVTCDFGVPVHASLTETRLSVDWNSFPYINRAYFTGPENKITLRFDLVHDTLSWSPVAIVPDLLIQKAISINFYFPKILDSEAPDTELLAKCAYRYEIPSSERTNASIIFTILDGEVQLAKYYASGKLYAQAQFDKGVPSVRTVDTDGDGVFETTEIYGYDKDGVMQVHSMEEEKAIMTNLFGFVTDDKSFYLHLIQVDQNGDTLPDFTEEYLAYNGKITSWDLDADGLWDIRYVRYPRACDENGIPEPQIEDALFYLTAQRNLITVTSIDGVPSKVVANEAELEVQKDDFLNFYWLGKKGTSKAAQMAVNSLNQLNRQGCSITIDYGMENLFCVRTGEFYFGRIVDSAILTKEIPEDKQEALVK